MKGKRGEEGEGGKRLCDNEIERKNRVDGNLKRKSKNGMICT